MSILLNIQNLEVSFPLARGREMRALRGMQLLVLRGATLGLLGESGCGKSTLARALLRLLPNGARVTGAIDLEGRDLLQLSEREMARVRGKRIALIPQDPGQALNPVMRVGDQVAEVLRAHRKETWKRCRDEAEELLQRTHLEAGDRRMFDAYPHQLSGGQKQRVVIAQALACRPSLIVADEPTASLDTSLGNQIVALLNEIRAQENTSLLLITHNPALLVGIADRVAVMYAGRIVEEGPAKEIFHRARHPYTRALLNCMRADSAPNPRRNGMRLPIIAGAAPDASAIIPGCSFAPRCTERMACCEMKPPATPDREDTSRVECLLYE